jgi:hypothetical protein
LICIKVEDSSTWSDLKRDRSEYLAMAQTGSQDLGWAEGWGLVRQVHEKLEFVAFFDIREDAEAAAAEAGVDWMLSGKFPPHAVLLDAQSMAGREMAFEHLAAPATIEADDIIAMNGLPDCDGGCPAQPPFRLPVLPRPTSA